MDRRDFLTSLAGYTTALSLFDLDALLAASGYHESGPYSGPLLSTYVHSTCGACPGGCGIRVRQVDGLPVKVDGNPVHPVNRGGLCPVGAASLALMVHPDRIRTPLRRSGPRGSGEFTPVSWSEAESLLVEHLSELKAAGHPEQLLFLDGREHGVGLDLARQFVAEFGSPNLYHDHDPGARVAASISGGEGTDVVYDFEDAKTIFCFGQPVFEAGRNPVYFAGLRGRMLDRPEGERGSFIVIDPRLSASAAKAERWIPIRPGTHGLLALGMIYLIIKERLHDTKAVERFLSGFEDTFDRQGRRTEGFKSSVLKRYYPAFVSEGTGIPVDQIISLARLFATTSRAVAIWGHGVSQTADGIYQAWTIMALNALMGRWGKPGGIQSAGRYPISAPQPKAVAAHPLVAATAGEYPFLEGRGAIESLPDRILAGTPYAIRTAIFNNVNPVYDSPQANRFRQAMQNIPFSVVITSLENQTSLLADLVLPDCTFLEKHDLTMRGSDFAHPVVGLTQPAIKPLYESRQADDVILALGRKLLGGSWLEWTSYSSYIAAKTRDLYEANAGSLFSEQFKVSFESLLAERGWRRKEYGSFSEFWEHFKSTGGWWNPLPLLAPGSTRYPTSSGKFYLVSKPLRGRLRGEADTAVNALKRAGLQMENGSMYMLGAYRTFREEAEGPFPLNLYPIELTTLRGVGGRLDKMADMVGYYDNVKWQSWVELNPETAAEHGLAERQQVWVESATGKLQLTLILNAGLMPGVAAVPVGLGKHGTFQFGENLNRIAGSARDCFTGLPAFVETRVRVYVSS